MADVVFCDGTVADATAFALEMSAPHVHPFLLFWRGEPCGIFWLTNLEGRSCRVHFALHAEYALLAREIGRASLRILLHGDSGFDSICFDVVVGMVPECNMRAINLAKKSGFRYVGTIPNGAWIAKKNKSVGMVVLAATRETI